jgi:hypothetical protein
MPRQSINAMMTVAVPLPGHGPKPPKPPRELGPAAAKLWRAIAADRPADWFTPATLRLLQRFCRTAIYAERLHDGLDREPVGSETAVVLFKQTMNANASLGILASKMRLSTQIAVERRSAKAGAPSRPTPLWPS